MITLSSKAKYGLIALAVIIILFIASIFIVPFFIDEEQIKTRIQADLTKQLGYEVTIFGADASFFLKPKVLLTNISIANHPEGISSKLATIQEAEITLDMLAFLSGDYQVNHIDLRYVIIELEELSSGKYTISLPDNFSNFSSSNFLTPNITLTNGRLNFTPQGTKNIYEFDQINFTSSATSSDSFDATMTFTHASEAFTLEVDSDYVIGEQGKNIDITLDSSLKHSNETISYKGTLGRENDTLKTDGIISLDITDIQKWINFLDAKAKEQQLYSVLTGSHHLKGDIRLKQARSALVFASENLILDTQPMAISGSMLFKDIILFKYKTSISKLVAKAEFDKNYSISQANALFRKFLPRNMKGTFDLSVKELEFGNITMNNIKLSGMLQDGEFTINQAVSKLAGNTQLLLFGILKSDVNRNINLDGNMELIGDDIQAFMTALNLDEHKLLANHSGSFRAKANLYFSAENSTISELRFQAGDFFVEGGIEYRPRADTQYEASLKVSGGKLDSLARYVNPTSSGELLESDFDTPKITLPWLDSMENSYKVTLIFDNFTLYDLQGKPSRFIVSIAPHEMFFNSVDLNVDNIKFSGNIGINQSEPIPLIDADFYLSHFKVDTIVGKSFRKYPVDRDNVLSVWSDNPLNVDFLKGYGGKFNIRFGEVIHDSFTMQNVNINAVSDEGVWDIREFIADIWNGSLLLKGTLDVTSIAAMKFEFQLKNILLQRMLESTVNLNAIRGRMNINGRIDTGGISVNNLIDNLSANIVLNGKDIVIKGFDMASLIQALPSVRSNSEVANTVRVALIGGQTTFRSVEGAFHITNGSLKTHGLKLRSKHAIGTMTGEANLITWAMNYAIIFKLPSLAISDFPELTLYFRKSMDDPLLNADTRNLESFMTQRRFNR